MPRALQRLPGVPRLRLLLASSSVAALLIGSGAPTAYAGTCAINVTTGTVASETNSTAINCVNIQSATVTGNITNAISGTITPTGTTPPTSTGITINGASVGGTISNAGTIQATAALGFGIVVSNNANLAGAISNSGTISAAASGINLTAAASLGGGISNSGIISSSSDGLDVGVTNFNGGISNGGTISAAFDAIALSFTSTFSGGITNTGAVVSAQSNGISVVNVSTFSGGIQNVGTISTGGIGTGILLSGVTTFLGGISNGGLISSAAEGIKVSTVNVFGNAGTGGITNTGTISSVDVAVDVTSVSTFAANISNSGTITGSGGGIIVTSVAQFGTASVGGGIVNSGLISGGGAGIVANADGVFLGGITNAATGVISKDGIGISAAGISNFSGGISNAGSISIQLSSGVAFGILVGNVSTFDGGITNSGSITSAGLGILVGLISSHTGVFPTQPVSTFIGNISNSGTIVAQTGIVISQGGTTNARVGFAGGAIANSGAITGTGGTAIDVSGETSPVTIDQTAGTITGAIKLSPNADVLNISGGAINGNIVGSGVSDTINFNLGAGNTFTYGSTFDFSSINQVSINSGNVILNGANNATTVTLAGGNLQVGDAADPGATLLVNNALDVNAGTLSGHGTVDAPVTIGSGGTLAPGGSIGSLTISGSLMFNAGSTYGIELSPTQHSSTLVNGVPGTVTINGGTVELTVHLGTYAPSTFAILTSTGTLSGQFNPTITYNSQETLNGAALSYDAHDVFLSYGQQTFVTLQAPAGATINEQNVANGLDSFILAGNTPPAAIQNLVVLSGTSLLQALDQIDGEAATGAQTSAFRLGDEFLDLMLNPFVNGRGYAPVPGTGGALGFAPDEQQNLPPDVALAYAAIFGKAQPKPSFEQRWSVWGAGYGGANTTNGDPVVVGSHNISAGTYGFAAGMDYRLTPNSIVGFALGGAGTNWDLANALGTGRSDALQIGVYGINWLGPAYVAAALDFSNHWFATRRSALGSPLTADFDGQGYGARFEAGYRYSVSPTFGITPYGAVQFQDFHTPAYSESDLTGSGLGLTYASTSATDTRTELGTRFDAPTLAYGKPLVLYGRLAWAHDFVSTPTLNAVFETLPGSNFTVFGAQVPHDSALASAGAQLFLSANWSLISTFNGDFAAGSQTYGGSGTVRYSW